MADGADRIVITSQGVVSAYGAGSETLHRGLCSGRRPFSASAIAGGVGLEHALVAAAGELGSAPSAYSRSTELALVAAQEALAGLDAATRAEIAVVFGGTTGGMAATERAFLDPPVAGLAGLTVDVVAGHPVSQSSDVLASTFALGGPRTSVVSACSSGLNALILARRWIEQGWTEVALAVGADALCRLTLVGFSALGAIDPEGTRPFQRGRLGLTMGEGAAAFVLERESHARRAGRRPLAVVTGSAIVGEAYHQTQPNPSGAGALDTMRAALDDARLSPSEVQAISAHGTGTLQNDAMECAAVRALFGSETPICAQKSQLGHTLGAAGALEIAAVVMMLEHGLVYPTHGLSEANLDPECAGVDHVLGAPRGVALEHVLKNSFAFGGQNAAVVLGRAG